MKFLPLLLLTAAVACGDNAETPPDGPAVPDAPATATAPRIVIVSPTTGTTLPTVTAALAFRVEDAPATGYTLAIGDGAPATTTQPIAIGAPVTAPLALVDGVNAVHLAVLDEHAQVADEETVVLVVDRGAAPVVAIVAPDQTYGATAPVTGTIFAANEVTSATIRVGAAAPVELAIEPSPSGYAFTASAALAVGDNEIEVEVVDAHDLHGAATKTVARLPDTTAPVALVAFPRDGQAVRARRVIVRGTVADQSSVASVTVELGAQSVAATVAADGTFTAPLLLAAADNAITVRAADEHGNASAITSHIYEGARLASGAAHGGAIRSGAIYAWGRNNLGQTGLGFASFESRTTYCDGTYAGGAAAQCKATTLSAIDAICLNPTFVTPAPADSPAALACRTATRAYRDTVCDAAGAGAPASCKTSSTANLATACDVAFGAATASSRACAVRLVCDGAYAAESPEHASCAAVAGALPATYPAPAPPYAPAKIATFVPSPGTTVDFASLGATFTSLSFNQNASSAIDSTGALWSWGDGGDGMLCLGDTDRRLSPARVADFGAAGTTVVGISRGYNHLLALRSDGTVWACGLNGVGQIGDGTSGTSRALPVQVIGLPNDVVQVLASSQSSYALTASGEVYAWGRNQYGNLGNGTASTSTAIAATPALVPGLAGVVMIAGGRDHVLAATAAGTIWAWGLNASHQVDGSSGNVLSPIQVTGVTDARAVYANGNQGFYENAAGELLGWGQNGNGNLGIPSDDDMPAPSTPVFGISRVLDVAIGALQGFAMVDGQVFGWGWSFYGSLGAGTSAIQAWSYRTPLLVQLP